MRRNVVTGWLISSARWRSNTAESSIATRVGTRNLLKMVFILGVNFPERNLKSLESFFGIGCHTSSRLLARFHVHPTCKVGELANKQVLDITAALSDMKIENDLRRSILDNIKRLKETGTYRDQNCCQTQPYGKKALNML
ncbi:hypothetical protein EYZ11_011282 [Aspergillus tanneri]|uniref:Uncharacterized protein n=1 Tax=Aspergillus tanneri TaxID=1220188 RepID=A0A4V3UN03_9EURO|nr:hypothetical protein EYZ11_011282 [Aspergillus tanneri]